MNIPAKLLKGNYLPSEKIQTHQKTASKYYKQYTKLNKRNSPKNNTKKNLKEEIINWFFSLDLITRLIVASIENKWVTFILHQLYLYQKCSPKTRFQLKEDQTKDNPNEVNTYIPQLLHLHMNNTNYSLFLPNDIYNIANYFNTKEEPCYNNYTYNSNSYMQNESYSKGFFNQVLFYKSEELLLSKEEHSFNKYCNYFTIAERILKDEDQFRFYFDKISNKNAFTVLPQGVFDSTNKVYNINLPDWIRQKENTFSHFSASEFFVAFFEQVISVRYVLYNQEKLNYESKNSDLYSTYLTKILNDRENITNYINYTWENNTEEDYLYSKIEAENIIKDMQEDNKVKDFVLSKFSHGSNYMFMNCNTKTQEYFNCNMPMPIFKSEHSIFREVENNLKSFFAEYGINKPGSSFLYSANELVNSLIFLNIEQIFSYDDILLRRIYETLLNLHAQKSASDLLNDLITPEVRKNSTGKRKKNKKRNTLTINTNEEIINDNPIDIPIDNVEEKQPLLPNNNDNNTYLTINSDIKEEKKYAFSFIKRRSNNNISRKNSSKFSDVKLNTEYIFQEKDFLGYKMLTKTKLDCSNEQEEIKIIVSDIINRLVDKVCTHFEKQQDKEKEEQVNNILQEKIAEINENIMIVPSTPCANTCNYSTNENNLSESGKLFSPSASESNNNDQNDTDTAYSSDGINSDCKFQKKKKEKGNKFFLYTFKEKNKNNNSTNLQSSNTKNNKNNVNININNPIKKFKNEEPLTANKDKSLSENNYNLNTKIDTQQPYTINKGRKLTYNKFSNDKNEVFTNKDNNNYNNYHNYSPMDMNMNNINVNVNIYNINNNNQNFQFNNNMNNFNFNGFNNNIGNPNLFPFSNINYNNLNYNNNFMLNNYNMNMMNNNNYNNTPYYQPYDFLLQHNPLCFDIFNVKLHKDIIDYSCRLDSTLKQLKSIKEYIINYLERVIKEYLKTLNLSTELKIYGSFASDLAIESSDIDITIKIESMNNINESIDTIPVMAKIVDYLTKLNRFENINPIYTASVPVIKLISDPFKLENEKLSEQMNKFKKSEEYSKYPFNKEELDKIKIDLTFVNSNSLNSSSNLNDLSNVTVSQVDYVRNSIALFPEIKPLIRLIKRLLQVNKLNNSFNGGLSSFSLFLLVLAYAKINRFIMPLNSINLGKLFIEFLLFYSNFFDFNFTIVDVNLDK